MSTKEAHDFLKQKIEGILKEYTRGTLDKSIHVIDISYDSLKVANARRDSATYRKNWQEFYETCISMSTKVPDYLTAVEAVNSRGGAYYLVEGTSTLLISKNFDTARTFISKVSNAIKTNDDFGVSFRGRNLTDIQTSRKLYRAAGSMFLQQDPATGKFGVYKVEKMPDTNTYGLVPLLDYTNIKEVLYLAQRRSTEYTISNSLKQFDNLEVLIDEKTKNVVINKRLLSVLDLGHGQGELSPQTTPAGQKLSNILQLSLGPKGKALVSKYLQELRDLHNVVSFEFKNTSKDQQASGYVVLSVQKYTRNNVLSISEGALLVKLQKNISRILKDVPGSNTIVEDRVEILQNQLVSVLTGKTPLKIKPHNKVKGKAKPLTKVLSPASGTKVKKKSTVVSSTPSLRVIPQVISLIDLQNLINRQLQDVISANMGDGNSRNVLNYRTGRLAGSAKVEYMSESRAGMITAFYSYMKNPYATFSEGGQQQYPKSRDPKLLISKSIREIAAQQVGNRLRAVNI
jgi:hypothetical protein